MKSQERKTLAYIAGIAGALGIILATVALFIKKKDMLVVATILLLVSSIVVMSISIVDGYANQGDFNSAIREAAPGATDDQYRCANNIVAASVRDLLSEPGMNNLYNQAVAQAKHGAKCDEGFMDTVGLCTGAETCKPGWRKQSDCAKGCSYTSLKDMIKELLVACLQEGASCGGIGPVGPSPGPDCGTCQGCLVNGSCKSGGVWKQQACKNNGGRWCKSPSGRQV
jgi:hypothetical protein